MLTKRDESGNGCLTEYNGSRRKNLEAFLRKCVANNKRSIKNLRIFVSNNTSIRYLPYRDRYNWIYCKFTIYSGNWDNECWAHL